MSDFAKRLPIEVFMGMLDLPAFPALEQRISLNVRSLERVGDDLRILARPAA